MNITPDMLAAVYELMRISQPFKKYKLPHADVVEFSIGGYKDRYG